MFASASGPHRSMPRHSTIACSSCEGSTGLSFLQQAGEWLNSPPGETSTYQGVGNQSRTGLEHAEIAGPRKNQLVRARSRIAGSRVRSPQEAILLRAS